MFESKEHKYISVNDCDFYLITTFLLESIICFPQIGMAIYARLAGTQSGPTLMGQIYLVR